MNNFQKQLSRPGIEYENRSINRFRRKIAFKCLVNCHPIDIGIIDEPDDLISEEVGVILRVQVGLGGLGGVELETFTDSLTQDVDGGVGFHDFVHRL